MFGTVRALALLLSVVVVAAAACSPPAAKSPQIERTVFTVSGMHCDSCNAAIAGTLQGTAGVLEASADYTKGEAVAVYRPQQVSAGSLKAEIEKLGYSVTATTTTAVENES
jgi:copper chaperone CopZ